MRTQTAMPRHVAAHLGLIGCCALLLGVLPSNRPAAAAEAAQADHVRLIIDYGDGVQKHYTQLPWRQQMSVLDALRLAQKHARGIRLKYRGKAATALVIQIDDLVNQGGGDRNWIYRVNDKPGNRSCGIHRLEVGDTVLWKFEAYR
jgi:hypothetical protein